MDAILDPLLAALGSVLAMALTALAVKLLAKVGVELDDAKRARLNAVAQQAVLKAEEWAAAELKKKLGQKLPGSAKMSQAVAHVLDQIPGVTRDEAEAVVTAALPQMGLGAAAGARELGKALRTQ